MKKGFRHEGYSHDHLPRPLRRLSARLFQRAFGARAVSRGPRRSRPNHAAATRADAACSNQQKPPEAGASINVEVPVVTLDVIAATQHGDILTGLKRENFRVIDDGAPQTVTGFGATDAPITIAMVMEFSSRGYFDLVRLHAKYWSEAFFPNLKQKDWVALVTFDMKSRIEVDFTQNKDEVARRSTILYFPGFSESNVFDAILTTIDQMKDVKGKKSMLAARHRRGHLLQAHARSNHEAVASVRRHDFLRRP